MKPKEKEPTISKEQTRRIFEEVQARTSSDRYSRWDIFPDKSAERRRELERARLIEVDEASQRSLNRALFLSLHLGKERFAFDTDPAFNGDVAYLTDLKATGLFDHRSFGRKDERKDHNRILHLDGDGNVAFIEFFGASKGIDLRGLTEQTKAARDITKQSPTTKITRDLNVRTGGPTVRYGPTSPTYTYNR